MTEKQKRRRLNHQPCDHRIRESDFENIAPPELTEESLRIHCERSLDRICPIFKRPKYSDPVGTDRREISKPKPVASGHRKRLVSWNCARWRYNSGWVRDPVKRRVMISNQDRSVSSIRALPLVINKTRTVTGATKPAQPKGGAGLASSHLQAGVI